MQKNIVAYTIISAERDRRSVVNVGSRVCGGAVVGSGGVAERRSPVPPLPWLSKRL